MAAISFAKHAAQALSREKPHSSITAWVDILTSINYEDEAYDGIPELVDSINLQGTGPTEASRALRKKIKHGNPHQQYRALVILKALGENCGHKFQTTFADGHLTDALKHLASDPQTDSKVKRKLFQVFASWNAQFKSDPSMSLVAGLYSQFRSDRRTSQREVTDPTFGNEENMKREEEKKKARREKEEMKEKERARREEEKMKREEERLKREQEKRNERDGSKNKGRAKRPPFDFEKEKPLVLNSIASASQASSNLVNAITLVNPETDSLQANERVQDCLAKAKQSRKAVIRYIQLVENEELIGTLIETNERIISAIEMYDKLSSSNPTAADISNAVQVSGQAAHPSTESEVKKLQEKQRAAVEKAKREEGRGKAREAGDPESHLHPDLQDLNFGPLGSEQGKLPPPIRPSAPGHDSSEVDPWQRRGSLSDFSDYESSDEEAHNAGGTSSGRGYVDVSDPEDNHGSAEHEALVDFEDPFADPFADSRAVAVEPAR